MKFPKQLVVKVDESIIEKAKAPWVKWMQAVEEAKENQPLPRKPHLVFTCPVACAIREQYPELGYLMASRETIQFIVSDVEPETIWSDTVFARGGCYDVPRTLQGQMGEWDYSTPAWLLGNSDRDKAQELWSGMKDKLFQFRPGTYILTQKLNQP